MVGNQQSANGHIVSLSKEHYIWYHTTSSSCKTSFDLISNKYLILFKFFNRFHNVKLIFMLLKNISLTSLISRDNGQSTNFVEAAQALVPRRSNPLGTTTEFWSSAFEEYAAPSGSSKGDAHSCSVRYRRGPIPVYCDVLCGRWSRHWVGILTTQSCMQYTTTKVASHERIQSQHPASYSLLLSRIMGYHSLCTFYSQKCCELLPVVWFHLYSNVLCLQLRDLSLVFPTRNPTWTYNKDECGI